MISQFRLIEYIDYLLNLLTTCDIRIDHKFSWKYAMITKYEYPLIPISLIFDQLFIETDLLLILTLSLEPLFISDIIDTITFFPFDFFQCPFIHLSTVL